MKRRLVNPIIFIALLSTAAFAQTSSGVVKVTPAISVDKVKQGSTFGVAAALDISSGYHINSNRPTETYLIPTALRMDAPGRGLTVTPPIYPHGELKKFGFSPKPLSVYEGRVVIKFTAHAAPGLAAGSHSIHGKLTVQACNNEACLAPKTIDVDFAFQVVSQATPVNPANADIFGSGGSKRH